MKNSSTKKLLIITPWDPYGIAGVERAVLNLVAGIDEDYSITIIAISSRVVERPPELSAAVEFVAVAGRVRKLVGSLRKIIKQSKPDVIIGHVPHIVVASWLASKWANVNIRLIGVNHAVDVRHKGESILAWLSYFVSDVYVAVSDGIRQTMGNWWGIKQEKIVLIYNGLDLSKIQVKAKEGSIKAPAHGIKRVVSVGRLSEQKQFSVLLKAVQKVRQKNQQSVELYIVGDGPLRAKLKRDVEELGISDLTQFVGWQNNPYAYIASADVFVLPSRFEGFGIVLVEALALGIPIVSTDCPSGPKEILANGQYGTLVPVGDSEAIAEAIIDTLESPLNKEYLQQRAADFSSEKMLQHYQKII